MVIEPISELAFNIFKLDVPLELIIELELLLIVKTFSDKSLLTKSRLPPDNVNLLVDTPRDESLLLNLKTPPLTVVAPENELAPDKVSKPSPAFVKFILPEIIPVIALASATVTLSPDSEVNAWALKVCAFTVRLRGVLSLETDPVIVTGALLLEIDASLVKVTGPVKATPPDELPPPELPLGMLK